MTSFVVGIISLEKRATTENRFAVDAWLWRASARQLPLLRLRCVRNIPVCLCRRWMKETAPTISRKASVSSTITRTLGAPARPSPYCYRPTCMPACSQLTDSWTLSRRGNYFRCQISHTVSRTVEIACVKKFGLKEHRSLGGLWVNTQPCLFMVSSVKFSSSMQVQRFLRGNGAFKMSAQWVPPPWVEWNWSVKSPGSVQ